MKLPMKPKHKTVVISVRIERDLKERLMKSGVDYHKIFRQVLQKLGSKIAIAFCLLMIGCAHQADTTFSTSAQPAWVATPLAPNWGSAKDTANPNLLVLGDSISIGYTGPLIELLGSQYDIMHPADNCRNTTYTLENTDRWLTTWPKYDVIIWNNGIWDSVYTSWWKQYASDQPVEWYHVDNDLYETNLIQIARKLKATGARVIFFTTTDIPAESAVFEPGREIQLNEIAKRVLPAEGIEVYDLNAVGLSVPHAHVNSFDVHFADQTNREFAAYISGIVLGGAQ